MTNITEAPEQDEPLPKESLEGTHESPQQKTRIFRSINDLTGYIDTFKIDSGSWASGILQNTGEKVYQLTYISYQGE